VNIQAFSWLSYQSLHAHTVQLKKPESPITLANAKLFRGQMLGLKVRDTSVCNSIASHLAQSVL